ncbi:UDP-N-acetylglucosamine 4,6-dehydratase (inverting) [Carboxydothermus pertinax]|uniref:UDP-N-acetylglucosamine 4,6-dehydratase (Inverting) n=1 Tax=Carboxydothermus pertinax TaxID=870242 RepID=A0A1L8CUL1_9THEO|nr:UDP-N-acetylglucosamine 4,6-dehydratase (inverting) [Carboxydothermus pertinax]GAV22544.1 UDP-N-acetylglucosamine 4,6-dehydratase (inverting) [Carboxydothermus pertinax]
MLNEKTILITGGTGSFGKKFTEYVLTNYNPKKIIIFSRDEYKQFEMQKIFPESKYPIRYFIGDIRDKERLMMAFEGVDYVIHAAALKQVPAAEYNPFEAVKTNILGAQNIVEAALAKGVKKVVALSTDKAVSPVNLYGATKLAMEKIFIAANAYVGAKDTAFVVVRYGNVVGSRGSVIPFFLELKKRGKKVFPVTDTRMTRFWITLEEGVKLVLFALENGLGGEVFVPKIPSMKITDLVKAIDPEAEIEIIGIRPGEKLHESLISEDEARNTFDLGNRYVILPQYEFRKGVYEKYKQFPRVPDGFIYRSDKNDEWLDQAKLMDMIKGVQNV